MISAIKTREIEGKRSSRQPDKLSSFTNRLARGVWLASLFSATLSAFQLALPLYSMQIFDRVLPSDSVPTLVTLSLLMTGLILCSVFIDASRTLILGKLAHRIDLMMYAETARIAIDGKANGLAALKDIETIRTFVTSPIAPAVLDAPWSLAFIVAIFFLHPLLGWLTVTAIILMLSSGAVAHLSTSRRRESALLAAQAGSTILNVARQTRDVSVAMGMRPRHLDRLIAMRNRVLYESGIATERQAWIDAVSRGIRSFVQVLVLALAAYLVISHGLRTGAIVASSMLFGRALAPVERIGSSFHLLLNVVRAWGRAIRSRNPLSNSQSSLQLPALLGGVAVDNLSLFVKGRDRPILRQINLNIKPGQLLAIVGREGSGKSALARVIAGASTPSSGTVTIDGSNISNFEVEALGDQVGYLSDTTSFQVGSIADFIARGRKPNSEKVISATKLINAHMMIQKMSLGYQTDIENTHHQLSAGEMQRLALARAFYGSPRLLILDDPTAHLDDSGEASVLRALQELKSTGCTIIVISRLSGLLHLADQFIMLDSGEVKLAANQDEIQKFFGPRLATLRNS